MRAGCHPVLGFIGAGRVGTALARNCVRLGYELAGISDRRTEALRLALSVLGQKQERQSAARVAAVSDVLFLTVPDREISVLFERIAGRLRPGSIIAHCSGFFGVEVFGSAHERTIETVAFHPARVFPSPGIEVSFEGCAVALDGTPAGLRFGRRLARELGGDSFLLKGGDRPLYHAMCVFASNFQHALAGSAGRIARELGIRSSRSARMRETLMRTTFEGTPDRGVGRLLTGPVPRGDAETVAGHLAVLRERTPELVALYLSLTRQLVEVAREQGTDRAALRRITEVIDDA
ncbi:MAG TPA: DUF2520 domain-containing protein [candidate division WOR-3 bacterium]|uniref:DUF2520 domain-containing protein n=1 Tax=candidate division WOR-3 bacterium TaxID=2052148 RepID=A0A7V0T7U0_UNCW3|nr:DUF2520 domain-containing protein [candidate division WOR-3 bacterium]